MGNSAPAGICHSFTEDGRCVSLLKVLLSNVCIFDCAYCSNRRSNDIPRATFTVAELVELTMEFYRRNYIEGLFLSSGIIRSPDYTMESLMRVAKELRTVHRFGGYIHLKTIPGASPELVYQAGLYADRMSVNLELPSASSLKLLAPEKNHQDMIKPMSQIRDQILEYRSPRLGSTTPLLSLSNPLTSTLPSTSSGKRPPRFVPAGQSTQMIIGASPDSDYQILNIASHLYLKQNLKRVYYSGYVPINTDPRLPLAGPVPLQREHRLYQADWLMRFYQFKVDEIIDQANPLLDPDLDPKLAWALRHPHMFPINLDHADYEMILRVPGIGVRSAKLIVQGRRYGRIQLEHLKKMGVALKRAKYFIMDPHIPKQYQRLYPEQIRSQILAPTQKRPEQLTLFAPMTHTLSLDSAKSQPSIPSPYSPLLLTA